MNSCLFIHTGSSTLNLERISTQNNFRPWKISYDKKDCKEKARHLRLRLANSGHSPKILNKIFRSGKENSNGRHLHMVTTKVKERVLTIQRPFLYSMHDTKCEKHARKHTGPYSEIYCELKS